MVNHLVIWQQKSYIQVEQAVNNNA